MTDSNTWRHKGERAELVEKLIRADRRASVAEAELRSRIVAEEKHLAGNPDQAALLERIVELEGIIARQNELLQRRRKSA